MSRGVKGKASEATRAPAGLQPINLPGPFDRPTAEGWWLRVHRTGSGPQWFLVEAIEADPIFWIWLPEIRDMVDVARFAHPLMQWYGPVAMPDTARPALNAPKGPSV